MKALQRLGAAGLVALVGCASPKSGLITEPTFEHPATNARTYDAGDNHELGIVRSKNTRYNLQELVILGDRFYDSELTNPLPGEYGTMLTARDESELVIKGNSVRPTSDNVYVGVQVKTNDGEVAHRVNLRTSGEYALRADMTKFNTEEVDLGILNTTQADRKYGLKTAVFANGNEAYVIAVEDNLKGEEDKLGFYLVPVEGTEVILNPEGRISLRSEQGIFRPERRVRADIEKRRAPPPIPTTSNPVAPKITTPGQVDTFERN